jgi:hypothetical protein
MEKRLITAETVQGFVICHVIVVPISALKIAGISLDTKTEASARVHRLENCWMTLTRVLFYLAAPYQSAAIAIAVVY